MRLTRCYKQGFEAHEPSNYLDQQLLVEGKDKQGNLKLRICLDLTNLNKAIVNEPYYFKTPKDIAHLLAEACVITVCDCRKGYWHQQRDEASSFLTIFKTGLGRFWYTVMPFGAGDVFQRNLDKCFGKLKQVIIISDDIMVVGYKPNHSDHIQAFTNLLQIAQKCNVKLNYDKLQYKQNEVDFFAETYTSSGHKPARSKVSAITAMPSPTNKKQVQSFIGMINFLSKFSLRLSELAEPIRELSKDKVPFNWGSEHQQACTQIEEGNFKHSGVCLLQPWEANHVADRCKYKRSWCLFAARREACLFANKALTEAQKGYVATEIELFVMAWAMEKNHNFYMPVISF